MTIDAQHLWPSPAYYQYVEQLRLAVGQPLYVVEINSTEINAGVKFTDQPVTLLAIVDFPRPDPYRQLCPHMLILEDGRGLNLGRIARITRHSAFAPKPADILFVNAEFVQNVLMAPRSLSRESVAATSNALMAQLFGPTPGQYLEAHADMNKALPTSQPNGYEQTTHTRSAKFPPQSK